MGANYLIGVVSAVVAGTVAELLPPDGDGGTEKALKLVVSLLILCVVALPLLNALGEGGLLAQIDAILDEITAVESSAADGYAAQTMAYIREASADAAEGEIVLLLAERFGLPAEHCRVEVTLGEGEAGITLAGVKVYLSGSAILADPHAIGDYLTAMFGGAAVVVIE